MERDNKGDKTLRVIGILSVTRTLVCSPEQPRSLTTSIVGYSVEWRRDIRDLMGALGGEGVCSIR